MKAPGIDPALFEELANIAASHDCELIHAQFKGATLQLVLDRPDGVGLDHCSRVSREASALLDTEDFGSGRYLLEVSSPGIDRELYRPADFQRFVGEPVRVRFVGDDGARRTVNGTLQNFDDTGEGCAEVVENTTSEKLEIPLARIQMARLAPTFGKQGDA